MHQKIWKAVAAIGICGFLIGAAPEEGYAAQKEETCAGVETSLAYLVKIDAPLVNLHVEKDENSVVTGQARQGETLEVLSYEDGWVKVDTGSEEGYLRTAGRATVVETAREKVDEEAVLRSEIVDYALQFVGNPYVYGGSDPNTGADCSGFTSYIMRKAAGVSLSHSSAAQAGEGRAVSPEEMKPGDLIFYSNGRRINHVALYTGNGQIVHASTKKTGIKTSQWNYRTPAKIVSVVS